MYAISVYNVRLRHHKNVSNCNGYTCTFIIGHRERIITTHMTNVSHVIYPSYGLFYLHRLTGAVRSAIFIKIGWSIVLDKGTIRYEFREPKLYVNVTKVMRKRHRRLCSTAFFCYFSTNFGEIALVYSQYLMH